MVIALSLGGKGFLSFLVFSYKPKSIAMAKDAIIKKINQNHENRFRHNASYIFFKRKIFQSQGMVGMVRTPRGPIPTLVPFTPAHSDASFIKLNRNGPIFTLLKNKIQSILLGFNKYQCPYILRINFYNKRKTRFDSMLGVLILSTIFTRIHQELCAIIGGVLSYV